MDGETWETFGQVVREAGVSEGLVRRYERLGLIEARRDPYGRRLFRPGTAARVRALKASGRPTQAARELEP